MTATQTAGQKRATGAETARQPAEGTTGDSAWETAGETGFVGTASPVINNGYELSGGAVAVASKNSRSMLRQGYVFQPDGIFDWHGGCVTSPLGKCYDVYLPGAYPDCGEGRCSCPFFARHHVCKHIYFAVQQFDALHARSSLAPSSLEANVARGALHL